MDSKNNNVGGFEHGHYHFIHHVIFVLSIDV